MASRIRTAIHQWYQGKPYKNDPNSAFLVLGKWERHWTANVARSLAKYWKKEYKFIISTILGVLGIILALIIK